MTELKTSIREKTIRLLQKITNYLEVKLQTKKGISDEMLYLTPTVKNIPKDYTHYFQRLDYFISKCSEDVNELAVTGPYGSGKSTLLRTYFDSRPNINVKYVSLGTYLPTNEKGKVGKEREEQIEGLEKAIARQLLYQKTGLDVFGSKFTFTVYDKNKQTRSAFEQSIIVVLWAVLSTYIVFSGDQFSLDWFFEGLKSNFWFNWRSILFSFFLAVPICLLADVLRYLSKNKLTSINPKEGNFDFKSAVEEGNSFSLHLEELLRFFIATKSDVVVIEDLDRYDIPEVFESLKELNNIVNKCDQITKPVRFVYAVRDDIFTGSSRTKFFDAIIPLIPVMSPFNSYERFKELFKEENLVKQLEPVLRKVSIAVPDMRVLRNIVNEFYAYKTVLNAAQKLNNYERLLAFVVYKNLYSDDFAKLYTNNTSAIDHAVTTKELVRNQREEELLVRYELLLTEEKKSEQELLNNEQEYSWALLGELSRGLGVDAVRAIGGVSVDNLSIEQLIETIHSSPRQNKQFTVYSGNKATVINKVPQQLNSPTLEKNFVISRIKIIRDKSKENTLKREKELSKLKQQLAETRSLSWSLSEAIEYSPEAEWLPKNIDMPVLKMLLRDGLIDEHYGLYLNHILEGKLTSQDFAFLQALRDRQDFDPAYKASNYNEIVSYLSNGDSHSPASYNYGLLQYLSNSDQYSILREKVIIAQLKEHLQSIERLYKLRQTLPEWHKLLWKNVISDISINLDSIPRTDAIELITDIANYMLSPALDEIEILQKQLNEEPLVLEAISRHKTVHRSLTTLEKLDIKLEHLDMAPHLRPLVLEALISNIVIVNSQTLISILSASQKRTINPPVEYQLIEKFQSVYKLLNDNFTNKVDLAIHGTIIQCPNEFILEILNSELGEETILEAIENIKFTLEDFTEVPSEYWLKLFNHNKIRFNWKNIQDTISNDDIDSDLRVKTVVDLLSTSSNQDYLSNNILECTSDSKAIIQRFLEKNVEEVDIFLDYITLLDVQYSIEDCISLSNSKITALIKSRRVDGSIELFETLKSNGYFDISYILIEEFPQLIDDDSFEIDQEDFSNLLERLELPERKKLVSRWSYFIDDSVPYNGWFDFFIQTIKVSEPLNGLIKKDNGHDIVQHLKAIGIQAKIELNADQISSILSSKKIQIDDKLNFTIGQISHSPNDILTLLDENLSEEWSFNDSMYTLTPVTYALFLVCLEYELISSMRVMNKEIRVNHFRKQPF